MSCILRVGVLDSETLQHTNKRLQINILLSEPRPQINDKIDVKMVRKKLRVSVRRELNLVIFFLKILFVYHLASHPLVRMHPKKDRSNQRKQAKMINQ